VLFAALEERGLPGDAGPIGALRDEHREGRAMVRAMATALGRARDGDAAALHVLLDRGADYTAFIRAHISREDDGVFEMADRIVDGEACDAVCAAYDTVCSRRFEGLSLQDLEAGAADLIERYTP
jgi:hemerythrin-like domain-containing protein